jgi:hypothetical protein
VKINEVILEGITDLSDGKRFPWDGVDALTKSQNNARLAKLEKLVDPTAIVDFIDAGGTVDVLKKSLIKRGIKNVNDIDFLTGVGMALLAQQNATRSPSGTAGTPPATVPQTPAPTAPASANGTPAPNTPAPQSSAPTASAPSGWQDFGGVQIKPATGNSPTLARYKKNLFSLTDTGNWLDQNGRPANVTISAFLNQALDQT